ncbi:ABC transporter permease subunit [Nocardioides sp. AX2bis]|uniref:ABC transporter permease subunit n=1 Tax=Nocardioides sp. AX2bis TaxID=2653157 RepID=UPI0012EF9B69|nr:ABC transporter permease subunit [Nocardioides sp. AX2bis]VXA92023.1 ABC transporter permease [Nocardioides sp. AX2bis]
MTRGPGVVALSRAVAVGGVLVVVGLLPWLSGRDAAYTVLRARYADREATPEALAAVRAELGLAEGPWSLLATWLGGLLRGDLGRSWTSGDPVAPGLAAASAVSLTLTGAAVVVAATVAAPVVGLALRRGLAGRPAAGPGVVATTLTALPELVTALVLLMVLGVWLGWLPPYGWDSWAHVVLPALALGVPAGGLVGRLLAEAVSATTAERWVATWRRAGCRDRELVAGVLRRAVPSVVGQLALVVVGLTGGAVAVEEVFAVPGLGRLTLGAASAQDLPVLQGGVLALLLLAVGAGLVAALARRLMLGRGIRLGALAVPVPVALRRRRDVAVPVVCLAVLGVVVVAGMLRDPYASAHPRLARPGPGLPLGADASGRDLLARVGHGALATVGSAAAVVALCLLVGLVVGLLPRLAVGPVEVANAAPPVVVGLLVAAVQGPSAAGAAAAVALVSWAPLAAHTAALLEEARARPHVAVLPTLGVSRARLLLVHLWPAVAGPVARHAALRLPGVALALAALGFLGLGPRPPSPQWGLLLAEGAGYLERAPWTVLAPTLALAATAVLAVAGASLARTTPVRAPGGRVSRRAAAAR